jgi:HEAT repeat protein
MLAAVVVDQVKKQEVEAGFQVFPFEAQVHPEEELAGWLAQVDRDCSWGDRQAAARKIGNMRDPRAVPALLAALKLDSFWIVRCTIIQALEKIGDPSAIPTLMDTAKRDGFQIVRSYAAKAVERLLPAAG